MVSTISISDTKTVYTEIARIAGNHYFVAKNVQHITFAPGMPPDLCEAICHELKVKKWNIGRQENQFIVRSEW